MKTISLVLCVEDDETGYEGSCQAEYDIELFRDNFELFLEEMEQVRKLLEEDYFKYLVNNKLHLHIVH